MDSIICLHMGMGRDLMLTSDKQNRSFRILYSNARSIIGKIDLLRTDVVDLKPELVMICEAGTNSSITNAYLAISGYSLIVREDGQDTTEGWCRGLLIWAKEGLKAGQYESDLIRGMVECAGVTIPWGNSDRVITVLIAYRPPRYPGGTADNGLSDRFCNLLASIQGQVVICGDLNYSGIDWKKLYGSTPAERNVLEAVQNHFWSQYIDFPTHVGGAGKAGGEIGRDGNILDLALCNSPELVVGVTDESLFSDHRMFTKDLINLVSSIHTHEMVPDWTKADLDKISDNLRAIDWAHELEGKGAIESWEFVKKVIDMETENCVP